MKKVKIRICSGTTCFVMGSETAKSALTSLTQKYTDNIEIISVKCLKICTKSNLFSKAPYVMVDDEIISLTDMETVMSSIERKLNE